MPDNEIIIATRQSKLALWQANFIAEQLRVAHPSLSVSLLPMTTKGDRLLDDSLAKIGGKGLFIKELEAALLAGQAHIAVHSMKDVPAEMPEGFALPVIGFRADPRDALVGGNYRSLAELPQGARVGSSSLRRQSQLLHLRPDLELLPVRGNVGTRLGKLDDDEYDALVLAAAGLDRLGLADRINARLLLQECLPAVGQGALGVECLAGDERVAELLRPLDGEVDHACVAAERALSLALGASCTTPLGGFASVDDGSGLLHLRAVLAAPDGSELLRAQHQAREPELLGQTVAKALLEQGGKRILDQLAP
ncbi:MAG: hydroxymethylbilane synthase [Pseudomonadales bacterium]